MTRFRFPLALLKTTVICALELLHLLITPALTLTSGLGCRFEPTCTQYAKLAILNHGMLRGSFLALRRVARCRPLGGHGFDPVPAARTN